MSTFWQYSTLLDNIFNIIWNFLEIFSTFFNIIQHLWTFLITLDIIRYYSTLFDIFQYHSAFVLLSCAIQICIYLLLVLQILFIDREGAWYVGTMSRWSQWMTNVMLYRMCWAVEWPCPVCVGTLSSLIVMALWTHSKKLPKTAKFGTFSNTNFKAVLDAVIASRDHRCIYISRIIRSFTEKNNEIKLGIIKEKPTFFCQGNKWCKYNKPSLKHCGCTSQKCPDCCSINLNFARVFL